MVFTLSDAAIDLDCVQTRIENNFEDTVFQLVTFNILKLGRAFSVNGYGWEGRSEKESVSGVGLNPIHL